MFSSARNLPKIFNKKHDDVISLQVPANKEVNKVTVNTRDINPVQKLSNGVIYNP